MDTIKLPLVKGSVSMEVAVRKMRDAKRSGIVWERAPADFRLLTAFNVARAASSRSLAKVESYTIEAPDITAVAKSTVESYLDTARLVSALSRDVEFGVLAAGQDLGLEVAILLVRSPDLLPQLEVEPPDCFCEQGQHPVACGGSCALHPSSLIVSLAGF